MVQGFEVLGLGFELGSEVVVFWEGLGEGKVGKADGLSDLDASALSGANDSISDVLEAFYEGAAVHVHGGGVLGVRGRSRTAGKTAGALV